MGSGFQDRPLAESRSYLDNPGILVELATFLEPEWRRCRRTTRNDKKRQVVDESLSFRIVFRTLFDLIPFSLLFSIKTGAAIFHGGTPFNYEVVLKTAQFARRMKKPHHKDGAD